MNTEANQLRTRLFNVVPAASYQMEKLLGLVDVTLSDEVPTAAVECTRTPRLLLNPDFVEQYCQRDGHLLMLVMHELQHVILGHTRLFTRLTPAHNLAFDAVINAMLSRQFPGEADFFRATNGWDEFPGRLLRPAPGWPDAPEPLPRDSSKNERKVHRLLYGDHGQQVTYHELFELLLGELKERMEQTSGDRERDGLDSDTSGGGEQRGDADPLGGAVLLGDHGDPSGDGSHDERAVRDATLRGVLRRIVEGWPPPDQRLSGRDQGRGAQGWMMPSDGSPAAALRRALRRLLGRAGVLAGAARGRRQRTRVESEFGVATVRPQARDRRAHAWTRLHGAPPVLWRGRAKRDRLLQMPRPVAWVYLDVSGSMDAALPILTAALREPHRAGAIRLFVFSTVVDEARPGDLSKQNLANTFGTDIRCVINHLDSVDERARPRRVLLLTDGYVGAVRKKTLERLRVSLYVGHYALYGASSLNDLAKVARHVETLPALPGVA